MKKEKVITPAEFAKQMVELHCGDIEGDHGEMDKLMVKVLRQLGYGAGCDIFDACEKWYA